MKRAKRRGLLRNVAAALSASDGLTEEAALKHAAADDSEPLVQEHALWGLEQRRIRRRMRVPDGSAPVRPSPDAHRGAEERG